jgi:hypothetical protein
VYSTFIVLADAVRAFFRAPVASQRAHWEGIKLSIPPRQLIERQPLPDNLANRQIEAVFIAEAHAIIVPESLLVQIAEQLERLDRNVCPIDSPLEQRPKIL